MAKKITQKELKHDEFVEAAFDFGHWLEENPGTRVRLLGVGGSKLSPAAQADLFGPPVM